MICTRAPFRIPLGGGGTDLPSYYSRYGGFILSAAITKYLFIYVNRPAADSLIRLKYSRYEQVGTPEEVEHDLVRPALQLLGLGASLEICSMADVPSGTGLGSSGTYLVALLTALYELRRERIPTQVLAEQACHIEIDLAGHPAGKHDQYLAAFGGITCLEIATGGQVRVEPLPLTPTILEDLRSAVLLFYTGMTRASGDILGDQRAQTESLDSAVVDSLHLTKDLGYRIRDALLAGELDAFGRLLDEHWQNKKRRSSRISSSRIDEWYELARSAGALGGKVMGAGGGGFLMFYCPQKRKQGVRKAMESVGLPELRYDFDFEGAKVLVNF